MVWGDWLDRGYLEGLKIGCNTSLAGDMQTGSLPELSGLVWIEGLHLGGNQARQA